MDRCGGCAWPIAKQPGRLGLLSLRAARVDSWVGGAVDWSGLYMYNRFEGEDCARVIDSAFVNR